MGKTKIIARLYTGPILCPGCRSKLFDDEGNGTLECIDKGCEYYGRIFRPTSPPYKEVELVVE